MIKIKVIHVNKSKAKFPKFTLMSQNKKDAGILIPPKNLNYLGDFTLSFMLSLINFKKKKNIKNDNNTHSKQMNF